MRSHRCDSRCISYEAIGVENHRSPSKIYVCNPCTRISTMLSPGGFARENDWIEVASISSIFRFAAAQRSRRKVWSTAMKGGERGPAMYPPSRQTSVHPVEALPG